MLNGNCHLNDASALQVAAVLMLQAQPWYKQYDLSENGPLVDSMVSNLIYFAPPKEEK